eukprot:CAMPEP_0114520036 /NCGR_PEP_ID=MMETSP0109-20121206/19342_1 /TAXON_ID=29199 /ORGANISM="Chlorarachnion reptans, Strain CCCM449" /LENGTH=46 /DNA_ID= /DNA_START= /DNA_END= /DNA_ORIENTATION=
MSDGGCQLLAPTLMQNIGTDAEAEAEARKPEGSDGEASPTRHSSLS